MLTAKKTTKVSSLDPAGPAPAPAPPAVPAPPMRHSCDRCHKQKLRCTRASNSNTGACDRCLRKRAECVYRSSLPKGRPSVYSTGLRMARSANAPPRRPVTPATPTPAAAPRDLPSPSPRNEDAYATADVETNADGDGDGDADGDGDNHVAVNVNMNADMDLDTDERFDTYPGLSSATPLTQPSLISQVQTLTDPWSWLGPLEWNDPPILDLDRHESSEGLFDWQTLVNSFPAGDPAASLAAFPNRADDANSHGQPGSLASTHPLLSLSQCGHGSSIHQSEVDSLAPNIDLRLKDDHLEKDPHIHIAKLAELSVQLSPLRCSSCSLAEVPEPSRSENGFYSRPLINDDTFNAVAAWLSGSRSRRLHAPDADTMGALLYQTFSSTHHLLEILRDLQAKIDTTIPAGFTPTSSLTPSTSSVSEHSYFSLPKGRSSSSTTPSHSHNHSRNSSHNCNDIIHHLAIVCHTMLLDIYTAVLVIIERDTNTGSRRDKEVLGNIWLMSTVQLCSYLTQRQHQAMDIYLASQTSFTTTTLKEINLVALTGALQPDASPSNAATRESLKDLQMEIQERLVRLQQKLSL
ncbi:hypothetical protein DL769_001815 [Monosporascus sp. CRB-8-3]|nr:hypothetical protein DL769_001815 [Monosporascus sp. CRB-8-3]